MMKYAKVKSAVFQVDLGQIQKPETLTAHSSKQRGGVICASTVAQRKKGKKKKKEGGEGGGKGRLST